MWGTATFSSAAAARAKRKLETWDPVTGANLGLQSLSLLPTTATLAAISFRLL